MHCWSAPKAEQDWADVILNSLISIRNEVFAKARCFFICNLGGDLLRSALSIFLPPDKQRCKATIINGNKVNLLFVASQINVTCVRNKWLFGALHGTSLLSRVNKMASDKTESVGR